MIRVLALSGSLRRQSSNRMILEWAQSLVDQSSLKIDLFEGIGSLPHFNPDLDSESAPELTPLVVKEFRHEIANSQALLISSPEYAHGIPGSLKNALDWLVSDASLPGKPVVLLNVSAGDANHVSAQLTEVLKTMSTQLIFNESFRSVHVKNEAPEVLAGLKRAIEALSKL